MFFLLSFASFTYLWALFGTSGAEVAKEAKLYRCLVDFESPWHDLGAPLEALWAHGTPLLGHQHEFWMDFGSVFV